MKKIIVMAAIMLTTLTVSAQKGFYVSLAGGPTYKANIKKLSTSEGAGEGSYGEGWQGQLRGGYFFNDKIGIDLGVGYLHGDDQQIRGGNINPSDYLNIVGRARAFGASLSGVYNITQNIYARAGVLTKVAGKTEAEGSLNTALNGADLGVPVDKVPLNVQFEREGQGKMPLGFVAALGAKFKVHDNWAIFAEMEYQGIDVTPDKSTLIGEPTIMLGGQSKTRAEALQLVGTLMGQGKDIGIKAEDLLSISDEFSYSDNPDPRTQRKTFDVPYSSFGFAFGVTYYFNGFGTKVEKTQEAN